MIWITIICFVIWVRGTPNGPTKIKQSQKKHGEEQPAIKVNGEWRMKDVSLFHTCVLTADVPTPHQSSGSGLSQNANMRIRIKLCYETLNFIEIAGCATIEWKKETKQQQFKRENCVNIRVHRVGRTETIPKVTVNCARFQFTIEIVYDGIRNFSTVHGPDYRQMPKFQQLNSDNRHTCTHTFTCKRRDEGDMVYLLGMLCRITKGKWTDVSRKYPAPNKIWNLLLCREKMKVKKVSLCLRLWPPASWSRRTQPLQ